MADFYPTNMDALAPWWVNYQNNIGGLSAKYNITAPQLASILADRTFIVHWIGVRQSAFVFSSQLAAFYNAIVGNDPSLDPPANVVYEVPDPPVQVPPGIEFRVREIARQVKGHSSYSVADGELLGIIGEDVGAAGAPKPTIQCTPAASGYMFSIVVSKRGDSDAWQVWARALGDTTWKLAATATGKSADVVLPPTGEVPAPAQYDVRVQLRRSNEDYGEVSDNVQVTVNP